ncbi:hypothetical protein GM658_25305 [Pseudoduganella eburnea]|uniref:Sel1 repeat family protein n=1 Tax=Massilia eburnea TaxID=1776165 RepID=A0A6L6QQH2_9BURK|nr:hypothetical protein [Massilia eburnea]MTW13936.1 hypothetical protein [Massilia eburnea]
MEIFNKAGIIVTSTLLMVGMLIACQVQEEVAPPAPVVEAVAKKFAEHGGAAAERRLQEWAEQGSAVAARELGMVYTLDASKHTEAIQLLQKAARSGDPVSADYLANRALPGGAVAHNDSERSLPLYVQLATPRRAK